MEVLGAVIDQVTGKVDVAIGGNTKYYLSKGFEYLEVEDERAWDGNLYLKGRNPENPSLSDEEIKDIRANAYLYVSDPIFVQVMRGTTSPEDYIQEVAQIKFNNKYSNEQNKSLDEFFNEVATEWNETQQDMQVTLRS